MEFDGIAETVFYWLNYHYIVSKSNVLIESSIRFPLTEYIERRLGKKVVLEAEHPVFQGLHYDFNYKIGNIQRNIELKYLHDYSDREAEYKRYFDDIVRLAVLEGKNYFILCGERDLYDNKIMKEYTPIEKDDKGSIPVDGGSVVRFTIDPKKDRDFSRLLPLNNVGDIVSFCPFDFWPYVGGKDNIDKSNRQIPSTLMQIQTKLITKQNDESIGSLVVYIWEVNRI